MPQPMNTTRSAWTQPQKQRAIGTIVGAAVGDALGAPFEFKPAGTYTRRFPEPVLGGKGEMVGGGGFDWAPGEFTDDTQMGLCLAQALLADGGYDADTVWSWFRAWSRTANDVGITTRSSLGHSDWRAVPLNPHGAGTGALMRAFPLALAFLDAPDEEARSVVLHQAALTHHDPAAGWGAWVAVAMMRTAIVGRDPFDRLPIVLAEMPGDVRAQFAPLLSPAWTPEGDTHRNGAVWGCLAHAVWALRSTTSFEAALVAAVSLGDDADTVACVTGALAGARYGVQVIPSRWATYVHGHVDSPIGRIDFRAFDLQRIAMHLIGGQDRADTPPDERAGPTEVAPGLHAADLLGASGVPTDWAVVSLCRTGDRFLDHPNRRQVFLIDQEGDHNPGLAHVVPDAVAAVQAFIAEGLNVVVHCHGGRSRTGLVLKAWKMATDGCSERAAHEWLAERWGRYQDYNRSFVQYLRSIE